MIRNRPAEALYNQFVDFEAALMDAVTIIGSQSDNPNSDGNPTLFLFTQHLAMLNQNLYQLLHRLPLETAETESAHCGRAASALPSAVVANPGENE